MRGAHEDIVAGSAGAGKEEVAVVHRIARCPRWSACARDLPRGVADALAQVQRVAHRVALRPGGSAAYMLRCGWVGRELCVRPRPRACKHRTGTSCVNSNRVCGLVRREPGGTYMRRACETSHSMVVYCWRQSSADAPSGSMCRSRESIQTRGRRAVQRCSARSPVGKPGHTSPAPGQAAGDTEIKHAVKQQKWLA